MSDVNIYNIGDLVEIEADFNRVVDAAFINPTTVVFLVYKPDKTTVTVPNTNPSVGVFKANVSIDQAGTWKWRATGTGTAQASLDGKFKVRRQTF